MEGIQLRTYDVGMKYDRANLSYQKLIELYRKILLPRMIEEKMLILLRQGRISKWFSGIGQEAISVGATAVLSDSEYILPMHRNLGVFTGKGVALERLFLQFQGKMGGFTKGRDRSFHFGTQEHKIIGMISHLGPQLAIADGIALADKLDNHNGVTVVFSGDGGTSEGDFHEALNVAAVWKLPVIFIIENNGYGLSTPVSEQFACERLSDKGLGYGMKSLTIDGNNILEVYNTISSLTESMRQNPGPVLLECMTFRMRGHEEASGTKYVPIELFEKWQRKDPVINFENYLLKEEVLTEDIVKDIRAQYKSDIEKALKSAFEEPEVNSDVIHELNDVYAAHEFRSAVPDAQDINVQRRFVDAISDGLRLSLRKHANLILMGQDIAGYGGVFKITEGFMDEFGKERIRNTPLCESAIIGVGLGLAIKGYKSVVEMQFADFVTSGFNQIVNNLAKIHYRWGQKADVVIRMPTGAGVGAGPFHSQSNESWFIHTPGLKVVYPSSVYDAKGLMIAAIEDPNPVMFFEHKALYRKLTADIPDSYYNVEIGKARTVRSGEDLSIITYGMGVHWALDALEELQEIDAEIIDLRTLSPLDYDAICKTVQKTGKAIILHEDTLLGGLGAEISAFISGNLFEFLDAPVMRSGSLETPVPFASKLEKQFLPEDRFRKQLEELYTY